MQQGRVQLDSDWNEQQAILAGASQQLIRDLIGGSGAPRSAPGFEIIALDAVTLSHGRHFRLRNFAGLDLGQPFTIEAWVSARERNLLGTIFSAGDPAPIGGSRFSVSLHIAPDGHPEGRLVGADPGAPTIVRGSGAVNGDLVHLALSYDGRAVHLHYEGRTVTTERGAPVEGRLLTAGVIGTHVHEDDGGVASFDGRIHDVALHDRALDAHELMARRHLRHPGGSANLSTHPPANESGMSLLRRGDIEISDPNDETESAEWRTSLWAGPGRYYVDGVAVENRDLVAMESRSHHIRALRHGSYLAVLDTSSRTVNALQDPSLAEPALNGADTSVRVESSWRIELIPLGDHDRRRDPAEAEQRHGAGRGSPTLRVENIPEKNTLSRRMLNIITPWPLNSMITGSTNTAAKSMMSKVTKLASASQ